MADEPFTLIEETSETGPQHLFDNVVDSSSAKMADHDLVYLAALRKANPEMIVTGIPAFNVQLRSFAEFGFATCELDTETDSFASWRGYVAPAVRSDKGHLGEQIHFAKYHYKWNNEDFILYTIGNVQYVLKERLPSESALGPSHLTDKLITTIGAWQDSGLNQTVLVYDGYWQRSSALWQAVRSASWDKVILSPRMKHDLQTAASKFFDSQPVYADLGVPWKRGLIFHGPPGNGKTISIKALMHSLLFERSSPIPALYVRNAPNAFHIRNVFATARRLAPCMLVLEDVETIVTPQTRSYFFNELDGLENNDGLFVVASTNFLERLDPGLSKRPSRFDRKYEFSLPDEGERTLYCEFWRGKLRNKPSIEFPKGLCPAMAGITGGFSFAFLQECFVATLLSLARDEEDGYEGRGLEKLHVSGEDDDDLEQYVLWRAFKAQADALRKQIEDGGEESQGNMQDRHACLSMEGQEKGAHVVEPVEQIGGLAQPEMVPDLPSWFGKARVINSSAFALV